MERCDFERALVTFASVGSAGRDDASIQPCQCPLRPLGLHRLASELRRNGLLQNAGIALPAPVECLGNVEPQRALIDIMRRFRVNH